MVPNGGFGCFHFGMLADSLGGGCFRVKRVTFFSTSVRGCSPRAIPLSWFGVELVVGVGGV